MLRAFFLIKKQSLRAALQYPVNYLSPLVAIVALAITLCFWSLGLRQYQSTGT